MLLALKDEPESNPERLMAKGGFNAQVEVMNAASWLQSKGLVRIEETARMLYSLAKKQYAVRELPERVALKILDKEGGELPVSELSRAKKLKGGEASVALGWLKRKKWADIVKEEGETWVVLREAGKRALKTTGDDEELIQRLAQGEVPSEECDEKIIADLKRRKDVLKEHPVIERTITITDEGLSLVKQGLRVKETVSQLTPEMIQSGQWKDVELRPYDVNAFAPAVFGGRIHPLREIIEEIRRIFMDMGFTEIGGDFAESCFWNMDVLFVPQDHPARDEQDTLYTDLEPYAFPDKKLMGQIKDVHLNGGDTGSCGWGGQWTEEEAGKMILRTHTTVNTIRHLSRNPDPPQKVFSVDRVFRKETPDSTHLPEFMQIEGIVLEENASFDMLVGLLGDFYARIGFPEVRFRPGYFPYTEPSMEVEVYFNDRWMELGGSGIFRPEVTEPFGIKHPVLAWGLGLERLAMLRHDIKDIRELYTSDIRWLRHRPLKIAGDGR